jgi:hypothetical protein
MLSLVAALAAGAAFLFRNPGSFLGLALVIFGAIMTLCNALDSHACGDLSVGPIIRQHRQFLTVAVLSICLVGVVAALYRVAEYYLIAPLGFGLVFLLIEGSDRRFCERVALPLLVVVGWLVRTAPIIIYDGFLAMDAWFHANFALEIVRQGFIRQDLVYSTFASSHLMVASMILATGINDRLMMYLVSGLYASLALVPVYLLARSFLGYKASILGCLLIALLPDSINLSIVAAPISFGYFMVPLFLWAAVQGRRQLKFTAIIIFFFLTSSNALLPAVALFMLLIGAIVIVREDSRGTQISSLFILATALLTGAYWMYVSDWALDEAVRILTYLARLEKFAVTLSLIQPSYGAWIVWMVQNLPTSLLYALVMFACFHLLFVRRQSKKVGYLAWGVMFLSMTWVAYVADLPIVSYRWLDFAELLVAAVSGYGLLLLISKARTMPKLLTVTCLITIAAFASVTSGLSGAYENGYLSDPTTYRVALTRSELEAATFASAHVGVFESDYYVAYAFDSYYAYYTANRVGAGPPRRIIPVTSREVASGFARLDKPLVLRDYSVSKIFWTYDQLGGHVALTYLPVSEQAKSHVMNTSSRVFDDSNVIWIPEN